MQAFMIDAENNITVFASPNDIGESGDETETFTSGQELARLAAGWPGARLVEIWNGLPGVEPIRRFTSRKAAANRIWKAIQNLKPTGSAPTRIVASEKRHPNKQARREARPAARPNTKTARVIALLEKPEGATLKAIMKATGWQAHSVRGFIGGQVGKRMGLRIRSFTRNGERVYKLKA